MKSSSGIQLQISPANSVLRSASFYDRREGILDMVTELSVGNVPIFGGQCLANQVIIDLNSEGRISLVQVIVGSSYWNEVRHLQIPETIRVCDVKLKAGREYQGLLEYFNDPDRRLLYIQLYDCKEKYCFQVGETFYIEASGSGDLAGIWISQIVADSALQKEKIWKDGLHRVKNI